MRKLAKTKIQEKTKKLNKIDWIIIGILVLIYGIISFIRLGDTKAPHTFKTLVNEEDSALITLNEPTLVNKMRYYVGYDLGNIKVSSSLDGKVYEEIETITIGGVFYWSELNINRVVKYLKFETDYPTAVLGEVGLIDSNNQMIAVDQDEDNPLIDESDTVPDEISFMNSTYFDEIYYARSAYEYAHGIDVYEWTHPPLGKLLISIPIALFGFSPFTYRLMGNLFGILMIPLMYILAKKIFKDRKWALLAGLLMMFDNFHFAHTRIALVDGFQVAFIILSVIFMKDYLDLDKNESLKKKAKYLLLSGTFIGCAIATKWNAAYAAIGLAIVFFVHIYRQYNVDIKKVLKVKTNVGVWNRFLILFAVFPLVFYYLVYVIFDKSMAYTSIMFYYIIISVILFFMIYSFAFKNKELMKVFGICIIGFFIIPILIYALCYLLFPTVSYYDGTISGIIDVNKMMYEYHSGLDATHPFSSVWYQWPIMAKPVWFYSGNTLTGLRMTITDIGNPAIWWFGVISFVYLIINSIKKKDKDCIFIVTFIVATFVPYMFIGRLMFMYHYFITVPFMMLGIVAFMKWITEKTKSNKIYYCYIILVIIMFIVFYPIVSATPVKGNYVESLKWLSEWYF